MLHKWNHCFIVFQTSSIYQVHPSTATDKKTVHGYHQVSFIACSPADT